MAEQKKLKVGKHFGHGTKVTGPANIGMESTAASKTNKPHGSHNLQVSGHLKPHGLKYHTSSAPPGHNWSKHKA